MCEVVTSEGEGWKILLQCHDIHCFIFPVSIRLKAKPQPRSQGLLPSQEKGLGNEVELNRGLVKFKDQKIGAWSEKRKPTFGWHKRSLSDWRVITKSSVWLCSCVGPVTCCTRFIDSRQSLDHHCFKADNDIKRGENVCTPNRVHPTWN